MTLEITIARNEQIDGIAALFHLYRRFFNPGAEERDSRAFVADRLRNGDSVIFVALSGGEPCGFIQLYPLWSSWYCKRIWFLSDLYVSEDARKHGAGSQLVERVKEHALQTGASSVMVELPHSEPHLRAFYERLGFEPDDVFDLARYHPA